ncbi:class II fructose-bisphosphate aldolase [Amphibacillus sp. Q70]|uniref:class II fructose-bisphosphate aldolase n=1 Tax=Amphibacillus sp. Q70 TaxID=3453416 RepID=UPI003F85B7F3
MYVATKYLLDHANKNNYAIMAVNCINIEMATAAVAAAEEEKSGLIINMSERQMNLHASIDLMVPVIKQLAEKANVPIALNLDHGQTIDCVINCIQHGFSSVMIDASTSEFEENVHRTQRVVELASPHQISVEAELGHVGQASNGDNDSFDFFTNVKQATEFIKRTQIDALAIAVGTAHGSYPKGRIPKIDFKRLAELKEALKLPLVLHGGSGAGEENIVKAVECGINKINVCTDIFNIASDTMVNSKLKDKADYLFMNIDAVRSMKNFVKKYMKLIGSSNRYGFNKAVKNDSKE